MQLHPIPHQQRIFHQQVDVVSGMSPCQLELHDHPFQLRCMHRSEVGLSCTHANRVQELQELTHQYDRFHLGHNQRCDSVTHPAPGPTPQHAPYHVKTPGRLSRLGNFFAYVHR